jgi:hypothetical protein
MSKTVPSLPALEAQYRHLAAELAQIGFVSQGSVFQRKAHTPGSRYQWTWKDAAQKTKSLTLSQEQFDWLKQALHNQRQLDKTLKQMRQISHRILLRHIPGTRKRKPLNIRTLHLK